MGLNYNGDKLKINLHNKENTMATEKVKSYYVHLKIHHQTFYVLLQWIATLLSTS